VPSLQRTAVGLGIIGAGHGGYLALQAIAASSRFAAGVTVGCYICPKLRALETGLGLLKRQSAQDLRTASPSTGSPSVDSLARIRTPLLLLHGECDALCPPSHSKMAFEAVHATAVPTELVVYAGAGHCLSQPHHMRDAAERTCAWLKTYLPASPPVCVP